MILLFIDLKVEALGEIELATKLLEEVNSMQVLVLGTFLFFFFFFFFFDIAVHVKTFVNFLVTVLRTKHMPIPFLLP